MLQAIYFNDQSSTRTCEINDEISNGHLAPKVTAVQLEAF